LDIVAYEAVPTKLGAYISPEDNMPELAVTLFNIASDPDTMTFFQFGIFLFPNYGWLL